MNTEKQFKYDQENPKHFNTQQKVSIKCVYCAKSKLKLILDTPARLGSNERVYKYVTDTKELSSTRLYDYAVRYIYENLGILPVGVINTSHNGKECDALIYDWFHGNGKSIWPDMPSTFELIRELFETGKVSGLTA